MDLIEKNSQVVIHTAEAEASKSPAFVPCAEAIFGILSAMYLFALGFALLSGKTNGSEFRLVSLSPVVWCIFRMISKHDKLYPCFRPCNRNDNDCVYDSFLHGVRSGQFTGQQQRA